jgi:phosphatidylserine/phosphatidylglycerophosphate/cardiolipin synthase-like enzyme
VEIQSVRSTAKNKPARPASPPPPPAASPEPADRATLGPLPPATTGNEVTALSDGEAIFNTAAEVMRGARHGIRLEMFRLGYDKMVDVLAEQARRGVAVQVLLDPSVYDEEHRARRDAMIEYLRASGVDVKMYPIPEGDRRIDHVKLLIVDGRYALIGGMNWDSHSRFNADHDVLLRGPAVQELGQVFDHDWQISGGQPLRLPEPEPLPPRPEPVDGRLPDDRNATVRVATTEPEGRQDIRRMVVERINGARKSVYMEAFALTDEEVINALVAARRRGVEVKVLLDANKPVLYPNLKTADTLRAAGIEVRWYDASIDTEEKLHSKMALVDGEATILGSANFSYGGLSVNHEASVEVISQAVGAAFTRLFLDRFHNKGLEQAPDLPDYHERIPDMPTEEQYARDIFRWFTDYYHPGTRRNWVGQRREAILAAFEKHRGQADLHFNPRDDEETTIGKLTAFLEARGLMSVQPPPGNREPLWRERLRIGLEAAPEVARRVPERLAALAAEAGSLREVVERAQGMAPEGYVRAPADYRPDADPADTLRPEDLDYRRNPMPYGGGGLVLADRRAQVLARHLGDFYRLNSEQMDQVQAALATRDLALGVDPEQVASAPDPRRLPWQPRHVDRRRRGASALLRRAAGSRSTPVRELVEMPPDQPPPRTDKRHLVMSLALRLAGSPNFYTPVD